MPHALKTTVTYRGDMPRCNMAKPKQSFSAKCNVHLHTKQQATINHLFNAVCNIRTFFKCTVTNVALKLQVETSNSTVP